MYMLLSVLLIAAGALFLAKPAVLYGPMGLHKCCTEGASMAFYAVHIRVGALMLLMTGLSGAVSLLMS